MTAISVIQREAAKWQPFAAFQDHAPDPCRSVSFRPARTPLDSAARVCTSLTMLAAHEAPELAVAMDRYAMGDTAAFEQLYDALAPRLRAMLRRQGCDPALVEDLVQQTFLRIHCARGHYHSGQAVIPWAYAIARRLMIDTWRRAGREHRKQNADTPAQPPGPEEEAIADETADKLAHDLEELPPLHREAFTLVKVDGLSLEQTAGKLGTSVNAIKLRIHRAYQSLRGSAEQPK